MMMEGADMKFKSSHACGAKHGSTLRRQRESRDVKQTCLDDPNLFENECNFHMLSVKLKEPGVWGIVHRHQIFLKLSVS